MNASRWIRLDTTWSQSEWLASLDAEARLCWIELMCYVKAHGVGGRAKALAPAVAARMWSVTRYACDAALLAAEEHGALVVEDGTWVLTGWQRYQGDDTNAERQKRYRQARTQLSPSRTVTPVTRYITPVTDVTPTETETETLKKEPSVPKKASRKHAMPPGWQPNASHATKAEALSLDLAREAESFANWHGAKGNLFADWDKAFYGWLSKAAEIRSNQRTTTIAQSTLPKAQPLANGSDYVGG